MKQGWAFMMIMIYTFFLCNFVFEYIFLLFGTLNLIVKVQISILTENIILSQTNLFA